MLQPSRRPTETLIAWRIPLLIVAAVITVAGLRPALSLRFDRTIEHMFAAGDPLLVSYSKLKELFGGNELVVAVYEDPQLLDPSGAGIRRLAEISRQLAAVPGVHGTLSLDQQPLHEGIVDRNDSHARRILALLEGFTHSRDGRTVAVACILEPQSASDVPWETTVARIRQIVERMPMGMVAGEPVMVVEGFRYIEEDGFRLGWVTTLLLGITIVLCFRSLRWVIVPLAVVQLSILLTRATIVWLRIEMSMVSSVLTAIVTVVGVAAVMHIIVRFRQGLHTGLEPRAALAAAGATLAAAIFWSSITDAAGFLSLAIARIGPVRDFGIMMAIGAAFVLVSIVLLVPGLTLLGPPGRGPRWAWGEPHLASSLHRLARWSQQRPMTIALATLLVTGAAATGVAMLEVETDFTRNFRAQSSIVRAYEYIESHLGGAGAWDVMLPAPERPNWKYFSRVLRLEQRLRREVVVPDPAGQSAPGLTTTISLPGVVVAASAVNLANVRQFARDTVLNVGVEKLEAEMPILVELLRGSDGQGHHFYRIMLRSRERQPAAAKRAIIDQVRRIVAEEFSQPHPQRAEVAGFFVLLTYLIDSILRDQWLTFAVATVGIGLMMAVALRSPTLALVAMAPNVLPIFIITGLMGWLGIKINMGAAMIAAVSIGLSIDSSIHYLDSFRRARRAGSSLQQALDEVHQSVGRAVVFSTLALIAGFLVLVTSEFVPTIYFGVLVSLTMLGGLAGNLVVLPALLALVYGRTEAPTTRHQ